MPQPGTTYRPSRSLCGRLQATVTRNQVRFVDIKADIPVVAPATRRTDPAFDRQMGDLSNHDQKERKEEWLT
jgi:hypothetical protein